MDDDPAVLVKVFGDEAERARPVAPLEIRIVGREELHQASDVLLLRPGDGLPEARADGRFVGRLAAGRGPKDDGREDGGCGSKPDPLLRHPRPPPPPPPPPAPPPPPPPPLKPPPPPEE